MRYAVIAALGIAALAASVSEASARDGCGPGRYFDGYRCAPMGYGGYGGPGYYERHYYGPRAYGYGYDPAPGYPGYGRPIGRGMFIDRSGGVGCMQPGFTLQDGVCKPYRGY